MNKPQSLRHALNKAVPYVRNNPDKLHLFVDNGSLVATGASSMSWEYRYTLNAVIEDFSGDQNLLMAPVLLWLRDNQPDAINNLFNDGNNWQGIVESLTLPKFTRKYEKYRGGGMPGAVDVDLGLDDSALDTEFSIGGTELLLFKQMGKATVDGIQLRFTGSIQRDDTGEVQAVELVVRGRHKEVDSGEWKTGESNTTKVTSTNSYAKLTINGEVLYEVDLINMVEIVDGVDLMEAHRNALGL